MNIITQEAKKRQAAVKLAEKKGKSFASRKYGVSFSKRDEKHLYQWTAIDECTRMRFIYGFEEHTPENTDNSNR